MADSNTVSDAAHASSSLVIADAVQRFKDAVTPQDCAQIQSTKVDDVVAELRKIQRGLQLRRENRNLVKLYRFVQGLQKYAGTIEALSNGVSPYLPWIWAPIKLMLQITSDHMEAFDKLIDAYDKIAETLPRLDQLASTFQGNTGLMTKLALYYSDVLEFHRRAYKFVRRKKWKFFFMTTWATFDSRFDSILQSLAHHSDLITQEAVTVDIIEAKKWRDKLDRDVSTKESDRTFRQRTSVVSWLNIDHPSQDDECERLLHDCVTDCPDGILKNSTVESWLGPERKNLAVWLYGKPGAGKTVICARLLEVIRKRGMTSLSFFCRHQDQPSISTVLKTLILRLIDANPDLIPIAFTNFVEKFREPSLKILRVMLVGSPERPGLLQGMPECRIVIDGLDECNISEQRLLIENLMPMASSDGCKVLVCSREVPEIRRALRRKAKRPGHVSLSNEQDCVNSSIRTYARQKIEELIDENSSWNMSNEDIERLTETIVNKSDGMFLWAKLVLSVVVEADSLHELHEAISVMPQELSLLYTRILDMIRQSHDEKRFERIMKTIAWLTFAKRPLKTVELLCGIGLSSETPIMDSDTMLNDSAIEKCKPLVEELPDGTITLVHFTMQEFFSAKFQYDLGNWYGKLALSCVLALHQGLVLLGQRISQSEKLRQVAYLHHGLLPYAVNFWLDHTLQCATNMELLPSSSLAIQASQLQASHCRVAFEPNGSSPGDFQPTQEEESRLSAISHLPCASFCAAVMSFQDACRVQTMQDGEEFEAYVDSKDPTWFSSILAQFNDCVSSVLSSKSLKHVPDDQLRRFQTQYSRHVFCCRFRPCTWTTMGFASKAQRDAHEQLHAKRLFCEWPDCARGRLGFSRQQELRKHNKTHHVLRGVLVPPRIRKNVPNTNIEELGEASGKALDQDIQPDESMAEPRMRDVLLPFGHAKNLDGVLDAIDRLQLSGELQPAVPGNVDIIYNTQTPPTLNVDLRQTLRHSSVVCSIAFSRDGNRVATCCNRTAKVFNVGEETPTFTFNHGPAPMDGDLYVRDVKFTLDGSQLVTGAQDKLVRVWEISSSGTQHPWRVFEGHEQDVYAVDVSIDGTFIASVSSDRCIRIWDLSPDALHKGFSCEDGLTDVSISPDSQLVAATSLGKTVRIWDVNNMTLKYQLTDFDDSTSRLRFAQDGEQLVCASLNKSLVVYNMWGGTPHIRHKLKFHKDSVLDCDFTVDMRWILSASKDRSVIFWDRQTGHPVTILMGHASSVIRLSLSTAGDLLATGSGDMTARIWSFKAG